MGVDYSGHYGIGIKIILPEFDEDNEWFGDELSWLDEILENIGYFYFEIGDENITDEKNDLYLCINNPFEDGYCALEEKADKLMQFLLENKIEFEGKIDVVGGLEIW